MNLSISSITKEYHNKTVLHVPKLEFQAGELWGIIGPNGSGKSTLMKIIAGLLEPTTGTIYYNGQTYNTKIQKAMTLVFQKPYLLRSSVYQNVAYPLQIRNVPEKEIQQRVEKILCTFDIDSLKEQKAWTLSGGESQKVALARALVFKPELLILDEPTANIDPASIMLLEDRIAKYYTEEKPTILMVTHNIQQAKRLCSKVAFMHEGEIIDHGEPSRIFESENNPLIHSFIKKGLI
ncbi:MAG TPA: ABC transporter [Eubacteriaceae bacterium]|nr:ABC transporter [Eubacteriaceae bacterium]